MKTRGPKPKPFVVDSAEMYEVLTLAYHAMHHEKPAVRVGLESRVDDAMARYREAHAGTIPVDRQSDDSNPVESPT